MADDVDITQDRLEYEMAIRIENMKRSKQIMDSLEFCEDCDAPIPIIRQQAIKGCTRCIVCQTKHENHQRLHSKKM